MTVQQPSEIWNLRTVCFCLVGTLLATAAVSMLVSAAGTLSLGDNSFRTLRHGSGARIFSYCGSRLVALAVCLWFAKGRTRQDFISA